MNILEAAKEYLDNVDNGAEYFYQKAYPGVLYRFNRQIQNCLQVMSHEYSWESQNNSKYGFYPYVLTATDWQVHYAEPKLKPCAHCNSKDIWPGYDLDSNHWILCSNCRIMTDAYKSKKEAITAWNRRDGNK